MTEPTWKENMKIFTGVLFLVVGSWEKICMSITEIMGKMWWMEYNAVIISSGLDHKNILLQGRKKRKKLYYYLYKEKTYVSKTMMHITNRRLQTKGGTLNRPERFPMVRKGDEIGQYGKKRIITK